MSRSTKAKPAPIILAPTIPVDRRYRRHAIKFIFALLLASAPGCGAFIARHPPIPTGSIYRHPNGRYGRREGNSISFGLALPWEPLSVDNPQDYPQNEIQSGDTVIDLVTGRYCEALCLKVVATRSDYQVNVRVLPLDCIPKGDTPVTIDFSYQAEIETIIKADRLLARSGVPGVFVLKIDGDCLPGQILVAAKAGIDPRPVVSEHYHPIDLQIGDRVCWDASGVVGVVLGWRLAEDEHGFYQLMARVVHLVLEDERLQPADIEESGWLAYQQLVDVDRIKVK